MNTLGSDREQSIDGKYFSERAKTIYLSNSTKPSSTKSYFQFSNRIYEPLTNTSIGHGTRRSSISDGLIQPISKGRGRTSIPSSAFILQRDNEISPPERLNTATVPMFFIQDEVQFIRPYFGPPNRSGTVTISTTSSSHKRDILLSVLKEIESDLKTL